MFTADNNLNSDGSYEITGNIFIQIGIEILTFLNNFLTSDKLEMAADNFTTRLMKLVYVSDYSAAYILGATIIGEVLLTILLIVLTVVTFGAASAGLVAEAAVTSAATAFEATYTSLSTVATAATEATPLLSAAVATEAATAGLLSSLTLGQAYLAIGVVLVVDTVAFAADVYVAALASDNFMNSEDDITLTDQ
jgi:hypothetical protein